MRKVLSLNSSWNFTKENVGFENLNSANLELVNVPCKTCDEKFTRFFRDPKGEGYFICKNKHIHKN